MIVQNIIIIDGKEVDFEKLSKDEQENISLKLNKKVAEKMGFICQQVDRVQCKKVWDQFILNYCSKVYSWAIWNLF